MQEKLKEVLSGDFNIRKFVLFAVTALITLIVWNLPSSAFGIEGLTIVQQRVIAIFVMAVLSVAHRSYSGMGNVGNHYLCVAVLRFQLVVQVFARRWK